MEIFNSLTGKKETFKPKIKNEVSLYICGLTPYDDIHIGHARTFINFDVIVRFFRFIDYKVNYVRNITDVDDKIILRAKQDKVSALDLSQKYIEEMHHDFSLLGIEDPDVEPKVSDHINEIITMIKSLEDKGFAYTKNKSDVYFDVQKFDDYGNLANRTLDQLTSSERTIKDLNKNHEADFVLWKTNTDGITWPSPWGKGRPGWHIECSAMSIKYLGEEFDIHGGGLDLKFPHHENEIAQAKCATEKNFASLWMHTGPLRIEKEKMSKSLKNFITVKEILSKFHPEVIRLFFLMTHYRNPISYSKDGLSSAKKILDKIYLALGSKKIPKNFSKDNSLIKDYEVAMKDDFNTPKAIKILQSYIGNLETNEDANLNEYGSLKIILNSLGLFMDGSESYFKYGELEIPEGEIEILINERNRARENKDFDLADDIRAKLLNKGIVLEDLNGKTIWKKS